MVSVCRAVAPHLPVWPVHLDGRDILGLEMARPRRPKGSVFITVR
jgi:hypothetical protein